MDRIVREEKLFDQGDRIVVAVSGGPDSTALLHLLFLLSGEWGWQLTAAHANHGFRPEESMEEAEFVRRQCEERGIPFVYEELDVPGYLEREGGNPQEAARILRYRFLLRTAEEQGARRIALAHHADDQAETVLMRILRGTGVSGLTGISIKRFEQNVELIRPLLRITKNEILDDLERRGIGYVIDSSNMKTKYTRNRIRLEALPYLAQYNPSIVDSLNRLASLAAADDDYLEREACRIFDSIAAREANQVHFRRKDYAKLHVALQRRFIKLILNYLSPGTDSQDFTAVERVRSSLEQTAKPNVELLAAGDIRLIREYDEIRLVRSAVGLSPASYAYEMDGFEGEIRIPEASCILSYGMEEEEWSGSEGTARSGSVHTAYFDAGKLRFPLTVRNRRDGDRMRVMGLNGSKKVKDIFIDDKVPAGLRETTPIVTDADGMLLWIPGIRRSDLALVEPGAGNVFCIRCLPS